MFPYIAHLSYVSLSICLYHYLSIHPSMNLSTYLSVSIFVSAFGHKWSMAHKVVKSCRRKISCGFFYKQRVLKTFPGPGYLHSEDGVLWPWHLLINLYIWPTISSCYGSIPLTLVLIGRDGGLRTLCHGCGFDYQRRVLKSFSGPGYLRPKDGVVWLWHLLDGCITKMFLKKIHVETSSKKS